MKIRICLFIATVAMLAACNNDHSKNSGGGSTPDPQPPAPGSKLSPFERIPPVLPPAGQRMLWTSVKWTLRADNYEPIIVESIAWCEIEHLPLELNKEKPPSAELPGDYYVTEYSFTDRIRGYTCRPFEELKITQGHNETYVSLHVKVNNAIKNNVTLINSVNPKTAEDFWHGKPDNWNKLSDERIKTKPHIIESTIPLIKYRELLTHEYEMLTSRCRSTVRWRITRKLTPEKQGNLVVYIPHSTALDYLSKTTTFYEIDLADASLKMIAVSRYGNLTPNPIDFQTVQNLEPIEFVPNYDSNDQTDLEFGVFYLDQYDFIKIRYDRPLFYFAGECSKRYKDKLQLKLVPDASVTKDCRQGWQAFWPSYEEARDQEMSTEYERLLWGTNPTYIDNITTWYPRSPRRLSDYPKYQAILNQDFSTVPQECFEQLKLKKVKP